MSLAEGLRLEKELNARLRAVDIESWYDALADATFKSVFVDLTPGEAKAMVKDYTRIRNGGGGDDETREILLALEGKIDAAIAQLGGGAVFAKLSSRSPKDSRFSQGRALALVQEALRGRRERGEEVTPNDLWGTIMASTIASLRCTSGNQVIETFVTSDRVCEDDLPLALSFAAKSWSQHIIVRQFEFIPTQNEFRAFVMGGKLTALSQYYDGAVYEENVRNRVAIGELVQEWFAGVTARVPVTPAEYSMDLAVDLAARRVTIIELNPFGRPDGIGTGTVMFSNRDAGDLAILFGEAPFECRVVEQAPYRDWSSMKLRGPLKDFLVSEGFMPA